VKVIGVAVLKDLDLHLVVDNYATNKTQDPKVAGAPPMSVASSRPIALVLGSTGSAASGTAMCKHSGLCPQYRGE